MTRMKARKTKKVVGKICARSAEKLCSMIHILFQLITEENFKRQVLLISFKKLIKNLTNSTLKMSKMFKITTL